MKIAIASLATALIVYIGLSLWHGSEVSALEERLFELTYTKDLLEQRVSLLERTLGQCQSGYTREVQFTVTDNTKTDLLKVIGPNKQMSTTEVNFYVKVPDSLPMIEKLQLLADRLSRFTFDFHPINVVGIDNRAGERIGIVEVAGLELGEYLWGSAGEYTSASLIETFLQREYTGDWIDAVEFHFEGKPITDEWHYISLDGIRYRTKSGK